jgi:AAA+ superfamily predicted ATPase
VSDDAFEFVTVTPDQGALDDAKRLIGFERRYDRLKADLRLIADPGSVQEWSKKTYGKILPIVDRIAERYPLFVFAGDVGTGKTAFAKACASRLCADFNLDGNLYGLSTRVRGSGRVGEASTRINEAFDRVVADLGKKRLGFLLIDEADSLVSSRGDEHSHHEDKVAVNTIIQKVDDLRQHGGRLVVFLATNRVDSLDAAVLRRAASIERFERPDADERRELLAMDLAGLGLQAATVEAAIRDTGPLGAAPGHTFSDLRTRVLPRILAAGFPSRKITDKDVLAAIASVTPSPVAR